mmetsp:Transcript_15094/g.52539  ORF Transcript_15094/g.52539 Transcript_15094/m.52539 type:complete len:496 (-) Transcript_15094:19-1506(-)
MASAVLLAALAAVRRISDAHSTAVDVLEEAFYAEIALLAQAHSKLRKDRLALAKDLARCEAKMQRCIASADKRQNDADAEHKRVRAALTPPDQKIKLNVGGSRFETSLAVLTKVDDSMLGRMFGRCYSMLQLDPQDGSIFIDRDGGRFGVILDFLRDMDSSATQQSIRALDASAQDSMVSELDYFGLESAVFGQRPWILDAVFQPGPEMGSSRSNCAAVFAGGRMVVFGGESGGPPSNTTDLLDAETMVFQPGPSLLVPRCGCAAVQIDSNRVLVVGGFGLETTGILHLTNFTLKLGNCMKSARCCAAAVALDSRRILILGGRGSNWSALKSTEILSLDTMDFTAGPDLPSPRSGCAAVALDEFRFLIAGGSSGTDCLATTEILDVRTLTFSKGPTMRSQRSGCAAVNVDELHILVLGGECTGDILSSTELLNLYTMAFTAGPNMRTARKGCAAARIDAGKPRILVIGGDDGVSGMDTTEVLSLEDDRSRRKLSN